ncbi:MAG TPA: Imm27 family immunity protein [Polyangiaceae bacterium]
MKKIEPDEIRIVGHWVIANGKTVEDEAARRLRELVSGYLVWIASDESGWFTLYRDPEDGRYWEHGYLQLQADSHGGGPPSLIRVDAEHIEARYGLDRQSPELRR